MSFKPSRGFISGILKSEGAAALCKQAADRVAESAGPGWVVVRGDTSQRARFAVIPGDLDAIYDNADHSDTKARDNLRRALG